VTSRAIGDGLWLVDGPVVTMWGFPFPTRMAIARLASGALWAWSPIVLSDEVRGAIDGLGEPRFAVEPNSLHHLALSQWMKAWPSLRLWAPPGLAKKRRDLPFAGELGDEAPPEWRGEIDQLQVPGSFALTEVLFFHRASKTCLVGDLIQKHEPASLTGWRGLFARSNGIVGAGGSTPREWRASFLGRRRARAAIERAIGWQPENLVIAHGACMLGGGTEALRGSLRWLLG